MSEDYQQGSKFSVHIRKIKQAMPKKEKEEEKNFKIKTEKGKATDILHVKFNG